MESFRGRVHLQQPRRVVTKNLTLNGSWGQLQGVLGLGWGHLLGGPERGAGLVCVRGGGGAFAACGHICQLLAAWLIPSCLRGTWRPRPQLALLVSQFVRASVLLGRRLEGRVCACREC